MDELIELFGNDAEEVQVRDQDGMYINAKLLQSLVWNEKGNFRKLFFYWNYLFISSCMFNNFSFIILKLFGIIHMCKVTNHTLYFMFIKCVLCEAVGSANKTLHTDYQYAQNL